MKFEHWLSGLMKDTHVRTSGVLRLRDVERKPLGAYELIIPNGSERRGWDLNPRDLAIIGLAIRRHTRLPDPSCDLLATPAYRSLESLLSHKIEFCSYVRVIKSGT